MYKEFSNIYDRLMETQVDYNFIFKNILKICDKYGVSIRKVLESGVGSGSMTERFLQNSISVDGFDISDEMLEKAEEKLSPFNNLRLFKGDITNFYVEKRYDLIFSFFDVLNYVKKLSDIEKFIINSRNMLSENGLFMFDINSEYKLRTYLGNNDFVCEEEGVFYTWRNHLAIKHIDFNIDFFIKNENGSYNRIIERQRQYIHKKNDIEKLLIKNGFEILEVLDFETFNEIKRESFRILFVTKKVA